MISVKFLDALKLAFDMYVRTVSVSRRSSTMFKVISSDPKVTLRYNVKLFHSLLRELFPDSNIGAYEHTSFSQIVPAPLFQAMASYFDNTQSETIFIPSTQGANSFVFGMDGPVKGKLLLKIGYISQKVSRTGATLLAQCLYDRYVGLEMFEYIEPVAFSPSEATWRRVIHDMATALLVLRAEDLVHADIKTDNVLFSRDGSIRLCDFGSASKRTLSVNARLSSADCVPSRAILARASSLNGVGNAILDFRGFAVLLRELVADRYEGLLDTQFEKDSDSLEWNEKMRIAWKDVPESLADAWIQFFHVLCGDLADNADACYAVIADTARRSYDGPSYVSETEYEALLAPADETEEALLLSEAITIQDDKTPEVVTLSRDVWAVSSPLFNTFATPFLSSPICA